MSALQEYTDIKIICDAIEKSAIKKARRGDRTSAKVAALNSLLSLDQMLYSTELAVEFMKKKKAVKGKEAFPKDREDETQPQGSPNSQNKWQVCPPDYPGDKWEVSGFTPSAEFGFSANPFDAADADTADAIRDLLGLEEGEDLAEGFENCIGCDPRIQFDFQLQPVNMLLELENLLNQVQSSIDFWRDYSNPLNFLARFCDFVDLFDFKLCKQDFIAMLLALQGLLAKYANLSLNITLDWTVLFGPLLKFVLDALSQLIEQIIQLISAPIDCIIGALRTIDEIVNSVTDTLNVSIAAGQSMTGLGLDTKVGESGENGLNLSALGNYSGSGQKKTVSWEGESGTGGIQIGGEDQGFIPSMETGDKQWFSGNPYYSASNTEPPELNVATSDWGEGLTNQPGDGKVEFPSGFSIAGKDGLEEAMSDPAFKFASPMQKLILSLEEAKKWITSLFANVLFSLKSLSALVSGGISINLQNIGFLMMILDIINLVKLLFAIKNSGVRPCNDDIEQIADFIKVYYPGSEVVIKDGVIEVTQGKYVQEVSLSKNDNQCYSVQNVSNVSEEAYLKNKDS